MTTRKMNAAVLAGFLVTLGGTGYATAQSEPHFIDATARLFHTENIQVEPLVFIGPFAELQAGAKAGRSIHIGRESNIQDSVTIRAKRGEVRLGEMTILAHGSTVKGPAALGESGTCPNSAAHCPSFVGFNAEVDGAIIQKDAMVGHLAKVGRGVTIPSGRKVLPGKYVASQAEVDSKTAPLTEGDRVFMDGVTEVNVAFAEEYPLLTADANNRTGINADPGNTDFNPDSDLPTVAGTPSRVTGFRNRIIGDVRLTNNLGDLDNAMDHDISLRADEGEPFVVGSIGEMESHVVFHALEHTHISTGNTSRFGDHVIVHGGPTSFPLGTITADNATVTGNNVNLKKRSVFFRSRIGDNSTVGSKSLVQQVDCPAGTNIGSHQVVIGDGTNCPAPSYAVEW